MATVQLALLIPERATDDVAALTIRDVARLTRLSLDTLKSMNLAGDGPAFVEERGRVRYTADAVQAFQHKRSAAHRRLMAGSGGCS